MEAPEDGLKILLAESSATHAHDGLDQLRAHGHQIHRVRNSVEVMSAIEREAYDVVLMNLDQPVVGMSEIEDTQHQLATRNLSVMGVTTHFTDEKPTQPWATRVTWADLPNRLSKLMEQPRTDKFFPTIDLKAALECTDGDVELLQSLIELYFEQRPDLIAQIQSGVFTSDPDVLERGAHSLKGCVSVFAAADTRQAAFILETIGKESNWAEAEAALKNLEQQLERFEPALRELNAAIGRGEISAD